jgi:CHAT domain-containing protein
VTELSVVASGASIGVPLETLVDDDGSLLCDRYTLSYIPSATLHVWLQRRGRSSAGRTTALLLGDPPFEGNLPQLPGARDEIAALEGILDDKVVLLGRDASEESLVRLAESGRMDEFALLHFATHAHVDDRVPGRSALILSQSRLPDPVEAVAAGARVYDGVLTAGEIVREWKLDADLVTLSACETALGREAGGEGYMGLAHAFMQAGARSLLVSLWKVEDEATSLLMRRFYSNLMTARHGTSPRETRRSASGDYAVNSTAAGKAAALREAKAWLRDYTDGDGRKPYRHPFYWSAFVLVGDGS